MTSNDFDNSPIPTALLQLLAEHCQHKLRIVIFSGAGMSAESGIPTFRSGSNGLWSAFDPTDLATPQAWARDRDTVWAWYEWRRGLVMQAQPNSGHLAVTAMQHRTGAKVITQNVDDLHERAGSADVVHLHGSLFSARCARCGTPHGLGAPPDTLQNKLSPPKCTRCEGYVRPGVVWFGEDLDRRTLGIARKQIAESDLLLVVGTSRVVYPAAGLVQFAPPNTLVVEINPAPGPRSDRTHVHWKTTAAVGLPVIAEKLS